MTAEPEELAPAPVIARQVVGRASFAPRLPELQATDASRRLAGVPALDEIAREPGKAATLTPGAARTLHARCVVVLTALLPALSAPGPAEPAAQNQERKWLRPREASVRFNVPKRWLLAHAAEIPGTQRLSRKTILFEEARLERWLERHKP